MALGQTATLYLSSLPGVEWRIGKLPPGVYPFFHTYHRKYKVERWGNREYSGFSCRDTNYGILTVRETGEAILEL